MIVITIVITTFLTAAIVIAAIRLGIRIGSQRVMDDVDTVLHLMKQNQISDNETGTPIAAALDREWAYISSNLCNCVGEPDKPCICENQ